MFRNCSSTATRKGGFPANSMPSSLCFCVAIEFLIHVSSFVVFHHSQKHRELYIVLQSNAHGASAVLAFVVYVAIVSASVFNLLKFLSLIMHVNFASAPHGVAAMLRVTAPPKDVMLRMASSTDPRPNLLMSRASNLTPENHVKWMLHCQILVFHKGNIPSHCILLHYCDLEKNVGPGILLKPPNNKSVRIMSVFDFVSASRAHPIHVSRESRNQFSTSREKQYL